MTTYKKQNDIFTNELCSVIKDNKYYIPLEPANTDYQEYLQFLADGGVPEPADE